MICIVQTISFSHSNCHPSPGLARLLQTLPGLRHKMAMVQREERGGFPLVRVSFPSNLPAPMEEEVVVRDKTKNYCYHTWLIYSLFFRTYLCFAG